MKSVVFCQYYLYGALTQLYNIIGSMEFAGDTAGLVTSLGQVGTGVKDFFYDPSTSIITSPTEAAKIGRGLVRSTLNLVTKTTDATIGAGTNITRSFGSSLGKLSMDPAYNAVRVELNRAPRNPREMMTRPFRDIGYGLFYGVKGFSQSH